MVNILALIVDDEIDFLELAKARLESEGYRVITATNGKDAIKLIKSDKPNMVFLDIKMPEMDGVETLRKIRRFNEDIPVVMITAHGTIENWRDAIELGISSYIPKGTPGADVTQTMLKILKTHKGLRR